MDKNKITVYIENSKFDGNEAEVIKLLEKASLHDCNFSNRDFSVEKNDFTYVECEDEMLGKIILNDVNDIIM